MTHKDLLSPNIIKFLEYEGINVEADALGALGEIAAHWELGHMCNQEFLFQNDCDGWPDLSSHGKCSPELCPYLLVTKPRSSDTHLSQKFPVYQVPPRSVNLAELRKAKSENINIRKKGL